MNEIEECQRVFHETVEYIRSDPNPQAAVNWALDHSVYWLFEHGAPHLACALILRARIILGIETI